MDLRLATTDRDFVDKLVRDGRFESASEAVHEALEALKARDTRLQWLRDLVHRAIEDGGSLTSDEILASVEATLDRADRDVSQGS